MTREEEIQVLKDQYIMLSLLEEEFGSHSQHKAAIEIDILMRKILKKIKIIQNE